MYDRITKREEWPGARTPRDSGQLYSTVICTRDHRVKIYFKIDYINIGEIHCVTETASVLLLIH
jgi:hypothetical protein